MQSQFEDIIPIQGHCHSMPFDKEISMDNDWQKISHQLDPSKFFRTEEAFHGLLFSIKLSLQGATKLDKHRKVKNVQHKRPTWDLCNPENTYSIVFSLLNGITDRECFQSFSQKALFPCHLCKILRLPATISPIANHVPYTKNRPHQPFRLWIRHLGMLGFQTPDVNCVFSPNSCIQLLRLNSSR